jgi:hypothetical protein
VAAVVILETLGCSNSGRHGQWLQAGDLDHAVAGRRRRDLPHWQWHGIGQHDSSMIACGTGSQRRGLTLDLGSSGPDMSGAGPPVSLVFRGYDGAH